MKVIFIFEKNEWVPLTTGKEYDVLTHSNYVGSDNLLNCILIENDNNSLQYYPKCMFMTQAEIRDKKLGELGI